MSERSGMHAFEMTAAEAAASIRAGEMTSEELVRSCLGRIDELEPAVGAWAHLDPDLALRQAAAADSERRSGMSLGPLHGVPVGVKDIFDTKDMPTEHGTVLHAGRTPARDATAVALLRQAGAVILGKTVTAELAVYTPGKTRNPHDPERTPGGSSSGSAAAVAAKMVPLALGTQTNGSIIRPASYCGVCGYKPSFGLISRHRVLAQSRLLDQVGLFARSLADLALCAEPLMNYDAADPDLRPRMSPTLNQTLSQEPPMPPRLAFVRTPVWEEADADVREGFGELCAHLGDRIEEVVLSSPFEQAVGWHRTIMETDLAVSLHREYARGGDKLSGRLREMIECGRRHRAIDYKQAISQSAILRAELSGIFADFDAILTPAATGEAPVGIESTGSPVFCTLWTLCGLPTLSLPLLQGSNGMPIGVQLVAERGDDARLVRTGRWLLESLSV
jgi:Asp-tRNA(Asn)/Glu-tRNA(Gln) amidotransferase A subunit family amidase